jgi:transmembrane sensor
MHKASDERPAPSEVVMREARHWVARIHSHDVDRAEADALKRWLSRSPAHELAFAETNLRWSAFRSAALNVAAQNEFGGLSSIAASPLWQPSRRALLGGALAASAVGAAYLAWYPPLRLWPSLDELAADYRTETGQQREFALTETVSVEMNTRTSLSIRSLAPGNAAIEVISGEVAVTATSPVVVVAGNGRTRADRGAFGLHNEEGKVSVNCLDGDVNIACNSSELALRPGQSIAYDDRGPQSVRNIDIVAVEAWRRGLLIFIDTPLSQVIAEINRYRHGRIILIDQALGNLPVDATFHIDRIDDVMPRLADVFGTKARSLPGGIVLFG